MSIKFILASGAGKALGSTQIASILRQVTGIEIYHNLDATQTGSIQDYIRMLYGFTDWVNKNGSSDTDVRYQLQALCGVSAKKA